MEAGMTSLSSLSDPANNKVCHLRVVSGQSDGDQDWGITGADGTWSLDWFG